MQAVILAGGLGTRLKPMTETTAKCLTQIGSKPFLLYLLRMLKARGISDIVLCIGHFGDQIEKYFGEGRELGLPIRYSREKDTLLGTGGALKLAEKLVEDRFFVVNGDTYLDIDYKEIYHSFTIGGNNALIVANPCCNGERSDLKIDSHSMVKKYDKDTGDYLGYVNAGVLVLKKEVVTEITAGRPVSLESEVFPELVQRQQMTAFVTQQRFFDIGTFTGLNKFSKALMENSKL